MNEIMNAGEDVRSFQFQTLYIQTLKYLELYRKFEITLTVNRIQQR